MSTTNNIDTALKFIASVNRQKVDELLRYMRDVHSFNAIDRKVNEIGLQTAREVWAQFFVVCPDYMIHVSEILERGDVVVLILSTTGSLLDTSYDQEFRNKIIWTLRFEGGFIAELSIYPDNPEIREQWEIN